MMIFLGFILGFVFALILGRIGSHHLARKGIYASAFYDKEKDLWTVNGRFLCIAGKIGNRLKHENGEGVNYKC